MYLCIYICVCNLYIYIDNNLQIIIPTKMVFQCYSPLTLFFGVLVHPIPWSPQTPIPHWTLLPHSLNRPWILERVRGGGVGDESDWLWNHLNWGITDQ